MGVALVRCWSLVTLTSTAAFILSCQATTEPEFVPRFSSPADPGPVIARVGEFSLYKAQVPELARMARSLRCAAGFETDAKSPPTNELSLAVETLALANAAAIGLDGLDTEGKEEYQRLLARVLLERTVLPGGLGPVSDDEIQRAHQIEIEQYQKTGTSELFRPTRVDAMLIMIGLFPDDHVPKQDEIPVLSRTEALELARQFRGALSDRVMDLDRFIMQGREFTAKHPTVKIQSLSSIALDRRFASVDAKLHTALVALDGNGAISEPIEFDGGVYLIRRGYTSLGKGERPDQIRSQLESKARDIRRQEAFRRLLASLFERYRVQTWPERLTDKRGDQPQP
jgi:hypothetical protein